MTNDEWIGAEIGARAFVILLFTRGGFVELDDEVCLCFHVTKRKLVNFIRIEKPRRPAQMSECFGAGTGCGWCRRYITRLFESQTRGETADEPSAREHARGRSGYIRQGGGAPPPGATPIEEEDD